mgnify:CR=1 FL=1
MRILVRTCRIDSFDSEVEMTLIELSAAELLRDREKFLTIFAMDSFYAVEFFEYSPHPVEFDDLDGQAWFVEDQDFLFPPDDFQPEPAVRVDVSTLRYKRDGVMWHYYGKHSGATYETDTIPWSLIEQEAEKEAAVEGSRSSETCLAVKDQITQLLEKYNRRNAELGTDASIDIDKFFKQLAILGACDDWYGDVSTQDLLDAGLPSILVSRMLHVMRPW